MECPGKCTDESIDEVTRIPRKRIADHSQECPGHFKCNKCPDRFSHNTETDYLKRYKTHLTEKYGTDKNKFDEFHISLIDKVLSQQEQSKKEAVPQAEHAEF